MKRILLASCVAPLLAWSAIPGVWSERARFTHPTGNLSFETRWDPEAGLQLQLARTNAPGTVLIHLNRRSPEVRLSPVGAFPATLAEGARFNLDALPTNRLDSVNVILKLRQEGWSVYIGNRLAVSLSVPFPPPAILSQPAAALPAEDRRAVRFQKTDDFVFHDDFMVPEDQQQDELSAWTARSGTWSLRAVSEAVTIPPRGKRAASARAERKPTEDRSPNFYSLKGSGTNAVLTTGYSFYDAYGLAAAVQVGCGESGLVFDYDDDQGFFAFTVQPDEDSDTVRLSLWRTSSSNAAARTELAAVRADILSAQWIKLQVRTAQDRVQCFVDGTRVIDVAADLPAGGQFGLFANSDTPLLFDDVLATSNHELRFASLSDIRRYTLVEQGRFFPGRRWFPWRPPSDEPVLTPPASSAPQWLILGATAHPAHIFGADFFPAETVADTGLIAGYAGADYPYLRFTCQRSVATETFRLEKIETNGIVLVLQQLTLPRPPDGARKNAPIRLLCDATSGRDLRFYRDAELVLMYHAAALAEGASGVYVGPGTRTSIAALNYSFERTDLYTDQFEKNAIFVKDPFMRHWSSPEGQWDDVTNTVAWYKGDVFGRVAVSLPLADRTSVHLGIPDESTNGAWSVGVSNRFLTLKAGTCGAASNIPPISISTNLIKDYVGIDTNRITGYTVHAEGRWIWVTSADDLLLQQALPAPITGRRLRIEGFTSAQLANSLVQRYNVKDCLFRESLHEWTANGGRWEVVNRFNCDPRWSHMDGESTNGIAALWSKYTLKGDFCVELYVGSRHAFEQNCGDYNLTVLNTDTTPSQGYTVTCSGWDYDLSRLYTTLYRNGRVLTQSDAYCAPRLREGNKRKARLPLVSDGRDVHGAWYYIKFRRAGNRLEYSFDNSPVFSFTDPAPLTNGSLGIWTYLNSMVVARVKIAAEALEVKPVRFTPVPVARGSAGGSTAAPMPDGAAPELLANRRPLDGMRPEDWEAADPISQARLTWRRDSVDAHPYFLMTSVLGSGSLLARCNRPPIPYPQAAGWRFDVKRTERGQFNFYFSIGRQNAQGIYTPSQSYFYRISGEDFGKGPYRFAGASGVTGLPAGPDDWTARGAWTPVTVWIPPDDFKGAASDTGLLVRVEGFGNLQPGYVAQGLSGNGPGEGYAIRAFSEILCGGAPSLSLATNVPPPSTVKLWKTGDERMWIGPTNWNAATQSLATLAATGRVEAVLAAQWSNASVRLPLTWVQPPPQPPVTCEWSRRLAETLELRSGSNYLLRSFALARVTVNGRSVEPEPADLGVANVPVPRCDECVARPGSNLAITVSCGANTSRFTLSWATAPFPSPPVLTNLEGLSPVTLNFEMRPMPPQGWRRARVDSGDPLQGRFLTIFNDGGGQRLTTDLGTAIPLARYPLLQFRYRGGVMARVSLSLLGPGIVRLSETSNTARPVRGSNDLLLDNQWHTWQGIASDAADTFPYRPDVLRAGLLRFGSCEGVDQTGMFTELSLDDIVSGPAVSRADQLAFTPHYFDFEGVDRVQVAVRNGPENFLALDPVRRSALAWSDIPNHQRSVPDIKALADGLCHLFLRARNLPGRESQVTDIPFLLHRTAPKVAWAFEPVKDPAGNGTWLKATFETGNGPPLDLEALKFRWNDTIVPVTNNLASKLVHEPARDTLFLNWPLVFRQPLDASSQGDSFKIVLADIRDGAGNAVPDVDVPRRIDYATDRTPPTLLAISYPSNILWGTSWDATAGQPSSFRPQGHRTSAALIRTNTEPAYLSVESPDKVGGILQILGPRWQIRQYPYLTFRLRRPTVPTNDNARIDLVLDLKDPTNTVTIGLTQAGKEDGDRIILPGPVHWQSNVWETFVLDLSVLLKDRLPLQTATNQRVYSVALVATNMTPRLAFDLQNMFVLGPWGPNDRVTMDAYDESGMAGIERVSVSQPDHTVEVPRLGPGTDGGHGWIRMCVRDKAGNRSLPLTLPVYGANIEAPP